MIPCALTICEKVSNPYKAPNGVLACKVAVEVSTSTVIAYDTSMSKVGMVGDESLIVICSTSMGMAVVERLAVVEGLAVVATEVWMMEEYRVTAL